MAKPKDQFSEKEASRRVEAGAPADQLAAFLRWLAVEKSIYLCSPGYAGDMMDCGADVERLAVEYIQKPRIK